MAAPVTEPTVRDVFSFAVDMVQAGVYHERTAGLMSSALRQLLGDASADTPISEVRGQLEPLAAQLQARRARNVSARSIETYARRAALLLDHFAEWRAKGTLVDTPALRRTRDWRRPPAQPPPPKPCEHTWRMTFGERPGMGIGLAWCSKCGALKIGEGPWLTPLDRR